MPRKVQKEFCKAQHDYEKNYRNRHRKELRVKERRRRIASVLFSLLLS